MRHLPLVAASFLLMLGAAGCGSGLSPDALSKGIEAQNSGKLDEATSDYFQALAQDPKNKYAFYNLGQIAKNAQRWVEAEAYYRLALQSDANFGPALFGLAYSRAAQGATQEAIDLYQRDARLEPESAIAHYNLGVLLRATGQTALGNSEIARALQLDPNIGPVPTPAPTKP